MTPGRTCRCLCGVCFYVPSLCVKVCVCNLHLVHICIFPYLCYLCPVLCQYYVQPNPAPDLHFIVCWSTVLTEKPKPHFYRRVRVEVNIALQSLCCSGGILHIKLAYLNLLAQAVFLDPLAHSLSRSLTLTQA